jgi:hypothetical protein
LCGVGAAISAAALMRKQHFQIKTPAPGGSFCLCAENAVIVGSHGDAGGKKKPMRLTMAACKT